MAALPDPSVWKGKLPPPPKTLGTYSPGLVVGDMAYTSGVLPFKDGKLTSIGKVGKEVSVDDAYGAARQCALNALAILDHLLGGLENVERFVQCVGFVASAEGFTDQPKVLNGATDLLVEFFGEPGRPTRMAVGVAELPMGAPVELALVARRRP
jgi:enamine deaminase RidA (YjgF/YER057c/UK114 family)